MVLIIAGHQVETYYSSIPSFPFPSTDQPGSHTLIIGARGDLDHVHGDAELNPLLPQIIIKSIIV